MQRRPGARAFQRRNRAHGDCRNANREIAESLNVSEGTVKAHMKSIISKLGAKDRTHAVLLALKRGILEV
jgi:DNA-binding CsgD family transcriptional regulator